MVTLTEWTIRLVVTENVFGGTVWPGQANGTSYGSFCAVFAYFYGFDEVFPHWNFAPEEIVDVKTMERVLFNGR